MASTASREQLTRRLSASKSRSSRFDADGNVVEVETREDEEQNIKLQEITELLLAAGYFRARIKGLSPFDKVVGGLTWCIETCNIDVDIDLLFQENLTIGQKIALTEKIVAVLPRMNCPYRLEPHQIQGLDFIHIFPVVQWLVKRAIETREEMGDYIRSFSVNQFNKHHSLPEDVAFSDEKEKLETAVTHILNAYAPKRKFRPTNVSNKLPSEELQVQSTLLEYGRFSGGRTVSKHQDRGDDKTDATSETEELKAAEEMKSLLTGLHAMEDHEHKLSASAVGNIVGLQSQEIQDIASKFAERQTELSIGEHSEQMSGVHQHNRKVANLTKHIEAKKIQLEEMQKTHTELQQQYFDTKDKLQEVRTHNEEVVTEMDKLEEMENDENKGVLQKLRTLVAMNESLKKQEQEFKSHCKEEMARLQASNEELRSNNLENEPEDQERSQLIEKQYVADKEKLQKIRILLARKNREIAIVQRKIDEVPSRAELSQYQRRFVELYNQVAAKHKETKQFYTLYNTLDDSKLYLAKEVKLLNSILDNFTEAMSSQATKDQFLKQFEQIVDGIKMNRTKLEKKKQEEKMRRDILSDTYIDLVEKQRLYFKTVKDLKEECRKNEILLAKLKAHGQ